MQKQLAFVVRANFPELVLTAEQTAHLDRLCELRRLPRHAALFRRGERSQALYGVVSGEVALRFTALDGGVSVHEHVGAGKLFGLASFATGLPSTHDAVATRATLLLAMPAPAYTYLMDRVPGFARGLLHELARRHHGALLQLEASRHHSAMERLSLAIAQLVHSGRAGEPNARGRVFVRTTQAELAALANLSRQTTNELLAELARRKRARPVYGGLWVPLRD